MRTDAGRTVQRDFTRIASLMILPAICLLAFTVRFAAVRQIDGLPIVRDLLMDEAIYERHAREIMNGDIAPADAHFKSPLYPYFLAVSYTLFGGRPLSAPMVQILLDVMTCLMIYHIARWCFAIHVGRIAALLYALYGIAIFYSGLRLPETLTMFLMSAALLLLLRAMDHKRPAALFAAGCVFGLLVLIRPNAALIAAALFLWFLFDQQNRSGWRGRTAPFLVFLIGAVAPISPIAAKNMLTTGGPLPSAHGGINFYIGNNPLATGVYMRPEGISNLPEEQLPSSIRVAEKRAGRTLTAAEASRFWFHEGVRWLTSHPGDAFRLYLRKIALFWRGEEIGLNIDYDFFRERLTIFNIPTITFGMIAPFALFGLALAVYGCPRSRLPAVFLLAYMTSVVLFFVSDRYRLPVIPVVTIFTAFALTRLFDLLARPRAATAGAIALLFVLGFLINGKNERFLRSTHTAKAHYDFVLGKYLVEQNRFTEAIQVLARSLAMDGQNAAAFYLKGLACQAEGRIEMSTRMFQQSIAINPLFAEAHAQLGVNHGIAGDADEARRRLEKARALAPGHIDILINLGIALLKADHLDRAIVLLSDAVMQAPDNAHARKALGAACFRKGYLKDASDHLQQAIALHPHDPESIRLREAVVVGLADHRRRIAWFESQWEENPRDYNLALRIGNTYATAGEFEPAVDYYYRALDHKPDWPLALGHLGHALTHRRLFEEAREAFVRAVRLDPGNAVLCYNLACLYSLRDDAKTSYDWLTKALGKGYERWDRIMNDPDLENFRASLWFDALREQWLATLAVD